MPPAPRPIASRPAARPHQSRTDHPPSSLDAIWSYSRSAAFYGENLPSHPSFVDDRFRPRHDTTTDEESALTTEDSRDGERTSDAEEGWSEGEDGEEAMVRAWQPDGLERGPSPARKPEQLPPNARRAPFSTAQHRGLSPAWADSPSTATPSTADADEHTPLISSTPRRPAGYSGELLEPSSRARRPSTFSKEVWKARIEEHRGESSWGQTLFNTINVLIGVGLLADPLAFADSGWVVGVLLLVFCSLVTFYTAVQLSRLMDAHPTSKTYADVLIRAYGPWARSLIYFLFVLELSTFSVATVELFADSMASLYPRVSVLLFKGVAFAILLPTTFLPLRLLSLTSLLGIFSSIIVVAVLIADGTLKLDAPGSLHDIMPTSLAPRWGRMPLSFGLFMSGFSGHAVVPSLYRDMKNPRHFPSMAAVAFTVAFVVSLIFGVLGYLMFGNGVSAEITRDLAATADYPVWLNKLAVWMVALNPLVKYAIANKPLVQTFEHLIGLHPTPPPPPPVSEPSDSAIAASSAASSIPHGPPPSAPVVETPAQAARVRWIRYLVLRPGLTLLCVLLAVLIPEFDRVLAFLGSASAFVICVILPVGAYLITGRETRREEDAVAAAAGAKAARSAEAQRRPNGVVEQARRIRAEELERLRRARGEQGAEPLVLGRAERALCYVVLGISVVLAVTGTVWSFLPVEEAGLR
ncbi:hypothetical protein JCM10207_006958 [Rhodosporidiobolus poonsookiae]